MRDEELKPCRCGESVRINCYSVHREAEIHIYVVRCESCGNAVPAAVPIYSSTIFPYCASAWNGQMLLAMDNEQLRQEWKIQNECIANQNDTIAELRKQLDRYTRRSESGESLIVRLGVDIGEPTAFP